MEKKISDLQLEVQKAILDDPRTKEHGIEVLDDDGVITLQGRVSSHEVVESAESIVEDVRGVTSVINALEVQDRENEFAL
jgi:osmotically-inducible protein OsmY